MSNAKFHVPVPHNEPVRPYTPGSAERTSVQSKIAEMQSTSIDIPMRIAGTAVTTGDVGDVVQPHRLSKPLGQFHQGDESHVLQAIDAAKKAWPDWSRTSWEDRAAVFLKAADLLAGSYRDLLNGSTMLGQSKNVFQAEIDAACELIDFFRFNAAYAQELYEEQPESAPGCWNRVEHRPLEGFVLAITPFNFTSIAANLPTAPALMGNTCVWKPASTSIFSAHYIMDLLEASGLPPGVINMVNGSGRKLGPPALRHPDLAGVHFTGSTGVFQSMWRTVGENIENYHSYPRIVGETGGKDFIFAHASCDREALVTAMVRGAFEYQGQKCSAASRAYVPKSIWGDVKEQLVATIATIKMGPVDDFTCFFNAVIDKNSFDKCKDYIDFARREAGSSIIAGGDCDDSEGYFVQPTVIEAEKSDARSMCEEIFGPILTVHPYDDDKLDETLATCDATSPYALTGAIFAQDRYDIRHMADALTHAAGNFYINDKPTGAVVGQQPFGGSRASGTNDKAGSRLNLMRWLTPRTIKETFEPPTDYRYPFLGPDAD